MTQATTEAVYKRHAGIWARNERVLLCDFTARPFVLEELFPLEGAHVLNLGCSEGCRAHLIAEAGAAFVAHAFGKSQGANAQRWFPQRSRTKCFARTTRSCCRCSTSRSCETLSHRTVTGALSAWRGTGSQCSTTMVLCV